MSDPVFPGGSVGTDPDLVLWSDLVAEAEDRLRRSFPFDTAHREAQWLVEHLAGVDENGREALGDAVTTGGKAAFDRALGRRCSGEPLQYVLGSWPFRSLDLMLDPRVLIPRPETEWLVDLALADLVGRSSAVVVDLGCGSGAIGLSVARETNPSQCREVWLTDVEAAALAVARANLAAIGPAAARVRVAGGDWFAALPDHLFGAIGLIVTNPPYVGVDDPLDEVVRRWEPASALFAGSDGLDAIRVIVSGAARWLAGDGTLLCEIGAAQADAVVALAADAGLAADIEVDLAGRPRALRAFRA